MHAPASPRLSRLLIALVPVLILAGCDQGDGPEQIQNQAATPLPQIPPGFCDPVNFEVLCTDPNIINFNGGATTIIDNPDASGINDSERVAQMQKFPDQVFGGTLLDLGAPIDFSLGEAFTIDVWSPRAVPFTFKLDQLNVELIGNHSGSSSWEEFCFDFTGQTAGMGNPGLTIIFEDGVLGQADTDPNNWTFFYDNITQVQNCSGTTPPPTSFSALTFDDPAITYTLTGFGGAEDSSIVNDPSGGTNQVVQVNRSDSAETFAGTTISTGPNDSVPTIPLDAQNTLMTARVWSPAVGVPVRLKIEDASDGTVSVETEAITTVANAFETLTFDFSMQAMGTAAFDPAATYDKVTIFFNFGTDGATAGAQTYYVDDIDVAGGGGGGTPPNTFSTVTFDDPALTYTLLGFGGAEDSSVVADPTGGTNQVVQVNRSDSAETFAGTTVATMANDAVGTIPLDAMNTEMTVRVYSPAAGIPVRLKVEDAMDGTVSVETEAITTVANAFETLTFDFSMQAMGTAAFDPAATYDKVTIFFNFGTDGATAGAQTFFFDDIAVVAGTGGGGGTGFPAVTFDDPAITYALRGFGGAEDSTVVNDPTGGSNQVVQVNRSDSAETFAGTVVSTGPNETVGAIPLDAMNTQMTVRVYSPAAGIPVRLKVENSGDPTISVETEATTTVANAFETLTFDFSMQAMGTAAFDPSATYDRVIVFFNFGTDGATAGAQTFFFDDIDVVSGGGSGAGGGTGFPAVTFDDPVITYALRGFGGAEDSTVVNDPTGGSNQVVQVNRSDSAETFAGTVVSTGPNETVGAIPLDAMNTQMTVRVYSPAAGIPVRLKVENSGDPTISVETEATTTVANAFETLTFDFANEAMGTAAFNPAATYDRVIVFFNFGTDGATAGAQTFFFDDIDVVGSGTGGGGGGTGFPAVTFDDPAITYALRGFGGAEDSTVVNDPTGGSNQVVQVNRSDSAETFAGTVVSTGPNETVGAIPLDAMNTQMTVRVYSPAAGIPVRLKVENSGDPTISVETEATTTVANAFETLTFDFANEAMGTAAFNPAATYDRVIVFFNFGTDGATAGAQTFFFDDIDVVSGGGSGGGGGGATSSDFESGSATFADFEGGVATVIANPDPSGINTSGFVGQMQKFAGQAFGGSTLDLGGTVPLAAADSYTMKVRSQRSVVVTLKLEPQGDERTATHSGSGTWEELCFDFSGVSGDVTGITLIFDNGTVGDAANNPNDWTFQFDDIAQTSATCAPPPPPDMFETLTFDDPAVTYTLRDFGGAGSTVTNDPTGGTNMVVQVVRSNTAETFAGTVVSTLANEAVGVIPLDAMNTEMEVRVYSPAAGIPVRLKVENSGDPAVSVETEATTTVANAFETLTFDFSNEAMGTAAFDPAATYDKVIVFFNFGTDGATAGEQTFFFDDIAVATGSAPAAFETLTFDDAMTTYTLRGFGGAEDSTVVVDPTGGPNMVVQVNRSAAAETFAGTVVSTLANESSGVIPLDAMNTEMTVRVYSPAAGIPVRLKIENSADGAISVETEATTTVANAFETLTFDFSSQAMGTAAFDPAATYDKVVIFFNFGTDGATAGAQTYYFDDIAVAAGGGGGGGGGGFVTLTFDDMAVTYALRGFGGAEDSTIVADPTGGSNMVVQVNRSAAAETFAGTVVSTGANESVPTIPLDAMNTTMTVRTYSPAAGLQVRLKVENSGDPTISVETEATTAVANAFETLTFDFSNEAMGTAPFNPAATYDKIAIFFNFGVDGATAGAQTFFFDDIGL